MLGLSAVLMSGAAFTALAQQKENKNNKKEQQGQGQGKGKNKEGKQGNGNVGKKDNDNKGNKKVNEHNGKNKDNSNNGNDKVKGNNGKNNSDNGNNDKDGFSWTNENFKDRKNLRKHEKVTVCHKINNNNNEPGVSITVSSNALKAHMNHGDVMGNCPAVTNTIFSNGFLTRRTDYYNTLQNSYEQVSYSRSILDYALQRLTNSRLQLASLQKNNVAQAEIERKQTVVAELEKNVSLLETLIGVAANLVVNKLQQ